MSNKIFNNPLSSPEQLFSPLFLVDSPTEYADCTIADSFNFFSYIPKQTGNTHSSSAQEADFSTTTSVSDLTNSITAVGKRTFDDMNSQSFPSSPIQIDSALLHRDKMMRFSIETSSAEEIKKSSLETLVRGSEIELLKDRLIFDECKNRNPHLQEDPSFLDWWTRFQTFSKKVAALFEEYQRNPDNSNFDIDQLEIDYWDLLDEKFTIPALFNIYTLYYQDILQDKLNFYNIIFLDLNEKDNLDEWKSKVDEIRTKVLEIEKEYQLYEQNLKNFENEKSELAIREEFFQRITLLISELSIAENAIYELNKKLSIKAHELSKIVLEAHEVLEEEVTDQPVQTNIPASSSEENVIQQLPWDFWVKYEDSFINEIVPKFIKKGQRVKRGAWEEVAQMCTLTFKVKGFTATNCAAKWHNYHAKLKQKTGQIQVIKFHSIEWTEEQKTTLYKLVEQSGIVNELSPKNQRMLWDKVVQEMNETFETTYFTYRKCAAEWRKHNKSTPPKHRKWTPDRTAYFLKIAPSFMVLGKTVKMETWNAIAEKMNIEFNTRDFTGTICRRGWRTYSKIQPPSTVSS